MSYQAIHHREYTLELNYVGQKTSFNKNDIIKKMKRSFLLCRPKAISKFHVAQQLRTCTTTTNLNRLQRICMPPSVDYVIVYSTFYCQHTNEFYSFNMSTKHESKVLIFRLLFIFHEKEMKRNETKRKDQMNEKRRES